MPKNSLWRLLIDFDTQYLRNHATYTFVHCRTLRGKLHLTHQSVPSTYFSSGKKYLKSCFGTFWLQPLTLLHLKALRCPSGAPSCCSCHWLWCLVVCVQSYDSSGYSRPRGSHCASLWPVRLYAGTAVQNALCDMSHRDSSGQLQRLFRVFLYCSCASLLHSLIMWVTVFFVLAHPASCFTFMLVYFDLDCISL